MKKIFAFILALCMIFSLMACGGEPEIETEPTETEAIAYAITETVAYEVTEPIVEDTLPPETEASTEETIGFVPSPEATIPEVEEETFPPEDQEEVIDPIVYVTKTGEKYHTKSCRWGDIPMLLSEAIAAGYDSCDKCF